MFVSLFVDTFRVKLFANEINEYKIFSKLKRERENSKMNTDKMFSSIPEIKGKALINFDQVYV